MKENTNEKLSILIIIVLLIGVITIPKFFNKERKIEISNNKTNRAQFAMYKQKSDKSGYDKIDTGTFPSGYKLNTSLSHCEDNNNNSVDISSILSYSDGKAEVTSNKTIMCTLYLDEINTFSKILAAKAAENNPLVKEYKGKGWVGGDSSEKYFNSHIYHWNGTSYDSANIRNSWNVVFGGYCWQIIRTTENGGVKLLYNGEPDIGESNGEITYDCGVNRNLYEFDETIREYNLNSYYNMTFGDDYTTSVSGLNANYTLINNDSSTPSAIHITSSNASSVIGKYTCSSSSRSCKNDSLRKIIGIKSGTIAYVYENQAVDIIGSGTYNDDTNPLGNVGYMYNETYGTRGTSVSGELSNKEYAIGIYGSSELNSTTLGWYFSDYYLSGTNAYTNCGSNSNIEGNNTCYTLDSTKDTGSNIVGSPEDYSKLIGKYTLRRSSGTSGTTSSEQNIYYVIGYNGTTLYMVGLSQNHPLTYYQKTYYFSQTIENDLLQNPIEIKNFFTPTELQANPSAWQNAWPLVYTTYSNNNYFACLGTSNCSPLYVYNNNSFWYSFDVINTEDYYFSNTITYDANTNKYTIHMGDDANVNLRDSDAVKIWKLVDSNEIIKIGKAHYVCLDNTSSHALVPNTTECEWIGYVYYASDLPSMSYIPLTNGKYFSTDMESTSGMTKWADENNVLYSALYSPNVNNYSSHIKGVIDNWYETNFYNSVEESLIDPEEIYCVDRSTSNNYGSYNLITTSFSDNSFMYRGWDTGITSVNGVVYYDLVCANKTDSYSKNETEKGNGDLTYPIGLITLAEIKNLGYSSIRASIGNYWLGSPNEISNQTSMINKISDNGNEGANSTSNRDGIRPSIALKGNVEPSRGTGSMTDPYVVEVSNS